MLMGMNLVLESLAIIVVVTLLQCTEGNLILAGEDTPVWTARCPHTECNSKDKLVTYKRLNNDTIKRAFVYWKSDKFQNIPLTLSRSARSADNHASFEAEADDIEYLVQRDTDAELESTADTGNRTKRATRQYGTVEASVLVMVNYDANAVTDDAATRRKYVKEKILYVLAYWNSFNRAVYNIKGIRYRAHVQVKLVGIIIGLDRGSTPYVSSSLSAQDSLRRANTFWRNPPHTDFPRDGFHAVATMTDVIPSDTPGFFETIVSSDNGNSPSIIVWDKPNFRVLHRRAPIFYQEVGNYLRQWADYYPVAYDHLKPGKRVELILPGQLMSPSQQCVTRGYDYLERVCPEYSENCVLWCENKHWWNTIKNSCGSTGPALDGTPCVNGKVG